MNDCVFSFKVERIFLFGRTHRFSCPLLYNCITIRNNNITCLKATEIIILKVQQKISSFLNTLINYKKYLAKQKKLSLIKLPLQVPKNNQHFRKPSYYHFAKFIASKDQEILHDTVHVFQFESLPITVSSISALLSRPP